MKRDLTIVVSVDVESAPDWLWQRDAWKCLGCELLCLSWDNQVGLKETFLDQLDAYLEANEIEGIQDLLDSFDWYPSVKLNKKEINQIMKNQEEK